MTWLAKIGAALALLAAAFACGWFARPPVVQTKTEVQTVVKTEQVQVDHIVTKVVTVKEHKPDGTTTTTTTTEKTADNSTKTDSTDKQQDKATTDAPVAHVDSLQYRPNYSLGVSWRPDWRDLTWQPAAATVGYRVIGNAWVNAGYDLHDKAVSVGLELQF